VCRRDENGFLAKRSHRRGIQGRKDSLVDVKEKTAPLRKLQATGRYLQRQDKGKSTKGGGKRQKREIEPLEGGEART